ncbi:unnamed protein product [Closterium sp. NIES-54]
MTSLRALAFDHEGRSIQFDTRLDDLQLYLLSDSKDTVSLFDLASGAATAPPATADSATRSQWLTCDDAARLAIRNHLPLAECAHFGQHWTAQALYDAIVTRYSLPATAALGRLLLPYLFPELSAFATVEDFVSHLRTTALPALLRTTFSHLTPPPSLLTYSRSTSSQLRLVHLLYVLLVALRARPSSRGAPPPPLPPPTPLLLLQTSLVLRTSGLLLLVRSAAAARARVARVVAVAAGVVVGAAVEVVEAVEVVAAVGLVAGVGGFGGGGGGSGGSGGSGSGGSGGGRSGAQRGGSGRGQRQQQQRQSKTPSPQQLREWFAQRGASWELLRSGVAFFDLHYDAILAAVYALSISAEGDCYPCVPPDPGIEAASIGASESVLHSTTLAEALHTFTLDSGASRCFFRNSTTLTPLSTPVLVKLADPSGGPVLARSSTVLLCPAVPSGSLSGLHLPSFSTNLVSTAALQNVMITTTTPGGQCVSICTCTRTGRHLATFTHRPGSSMYTLATKPPQVAASAHVSASGQVAPPCSCRLLSHQTLLWHHRPGHPSLPRLRGMHSRLLVSGLPVRLQLRERFRTDLPVLRLHSNRGDSPQQNGIAERRIGLVMEVARTSMIHAAAPHFLWPFAVRYAAHKLKLRPRVSLPETSLTLRWTGKVGDASVFWVRGTRAFVRDTCADKLSARAIPCDVTFYESVPFYRLFPYRSAPPPPLPLFLAPGPPPLDTLPPQDPGPSGVSQVDPLPGTAPVEVAVGSGAAPGSAYGGAASGGAEPGGAESEGAGSGDAEPRGAQPGGAELWGVEPGGAKPEGAESGGSEPRGTAGTGAAETGGVGGAGAGDPTEPGAAGAGGAGARGTGAGGAGAGGAGAVDPGAGGAGGTVRPRPYFVPLLQQVLGVPSSTGLTPPLLCPPPDQSQPLLQPASPLPAPSPYTEQTGGLTERREPASRPASPVRTGRRVPCPHPPPVPGTHAMVLRPSSVPLHVPLPASPASSLSARPLP